MANTGGANTLSATLAGTALPNAAAVPQLLAEAPASSLKGRALRSAGWLIAGYGASQVLRLGSNLILTRLLFPEAFGLMVLVNTFLQGLTMFSDVGIAPGIIRSKRVDAAFLNTAWTLQVLRGIALTVTALLLAWPLSRLYAQPELLYFVPVVGLTAGINGFNSPALFTLSRDLRIRGVVTRQLGAQVLSLTFTIGWAWLFPSVWALIGGALVNAAVIMATSHSLIAQRLRLQWERSAAHELLSFGRFIFVSTAATFIAQGGERLILGKFVTLELLGCFAIALYLAQLPGLLTQQLTDRVLFPAFAELLRTRRPRAIAIHRQARLVFLASSVGLLLVWLALGPTLIETLYDARYYAAGWMVQLLGIRIVCEVVRFPQQKALAAAGKPVYTMISQLAMALLVMIGLPLALHLGDVRAGLSVMALTPVPGVFIQTYGMCRHFPEVRRGECLDAALSASIVVAAVLYLNY